MNEPVKINNDRIACGRFLKATALSFFVNFLIVLSVWAQNSTNVVSTVSGHIGVAGSVDNVGTNAQFGTPHDVAVDAAGNVYVADQGNHTIRELTLVGTNWVSATIAGKAGVAGSADGTGTNALFNNPSGVAVDANGNVYVADEGNQTIRELTPVVGLSWRTMTIAGLAGNAGSADGTNGAARFNSPSGLAVDGNGNVYVADWGSHTIREMISSGTNWAVSTIAGLAGKKGTVDGANNAARFNHPADVAVDGSNNVYVADWGNHAIREMTLTGTNWNVVTIAGVAGSTNYGSADGVGGAARFYYPSGLAVDRSGDVYVADTFNDTIRELTQAGGSWTVSTIAGLAGVVGSANGIGTNARFYNPCGVAVDSSNNVFVADTGNETIRLLGPPPAIIPTSTVQIPANAEIHGAGNAGLPDSTGGVAPVEINLPTNSVVMTVTNVAGTITMNSGGGSNDTDGVVISGSYGLPAGNASYVSSYGGISGIKIPGAGALLGVFEPATAPTGAPPADLDFTTIGVNFNVLSPALYQTFYIGDGLTGDGSGTLQQFVVPAGATRLFLGIADANGWNGAPGYYYDNSGDFTAAFQFSSSSSVSTNVLEYGDEDLCNTGTYSSNPKAGATLAGLAPGTVTYASQSFGHGFPFSPATNDYPGTDQIYVGSHQTAFDDGYSSYSGRMSGPQIITMNYASMVPSGQTIATLTLGVGADDFQFSTWGNPFTAKINGVTNAALTAAINGLTQTGPYEQFLTVGIDPAILQTNGVLTLSIDEGGNGGDGWAIDFLTVGVTTVSNGVTTISNSPPAIAVTPPSGLVAWWPGNGNALDIVGGNNGTLTGGVTYTNGEVGQAFDLDGTSGYVVAPASASLNVGTSSGLTIEGWIDPATTAEQPIVEWNNGGNNGVHLWISVPPSVGTGPGCLYANIIDTTGAGHFFASPAGLITTNSFQYVALTYDTNSGAAVLYINGASVAQQNLGIFTPQTSYNVYLGDRPGGLAPVVSYGGLLDEISIYNRALSSNEIAAIYNAGSAGKISNQPYFVTPINLSNGVAGVFYSQTITASVTTNNTFSLVGGSLPVGLNLSTNGLISGTPATAGTNSFTILATSNLGQTNSQTFALVISPAQNLLVNGGFESEPNWGGGVNSDGSYTEFIGNQIPGWTIETNHAVTIHISPGSYLTISGQYSANTDGEGYNGHNANFYQDFASQGGASYALEFNWQSWGAIGTPTTSKLEISLTDNNSGAVLFDGRYSYDGSGPHPVHDVLANFIGTGNSLRLRIQETPESGYNDNTFIIDNFSVTAVPAVAVTPPTGLVSWWRAESNALDSVGMNNGALVKNATYAPGEVGTAFSFSGAGDYVSVTNSPTVQQQNGITLEGWVFVQGVPAYESGIAGTWDDLTGQNRSYLFWLLNGELEFLVSHDGSGYTRVTDSTQLPTNSWVHVAATYDGTNMIIYRNGVQAALTFYPGTIATNSKPFFIGRTDGGGSSSEYWKGLIDEFSLYNRALSSNEIAAIYTAGSAGKVSNQPYFVNATNLPNGLTGVPYSQTITASVTTGNTFSLIGGSLPAGLNLSTNGLISGTPATAGTNSFTILATSSLGQTNSQMFTLVVLSSSIAVTPPSGMVAWWPMNGSVTDVVGGIVPLATNTLSFVPGEVGLGVTFGTNGYIDLPAPPQLESQQFTWEAWVRWDGTGPTEDVLGSVILQKAIYPSGQADYGLYARARDHAFLFECGNESSALMVVTNSLAPGVFYHVAGSYDGATFKLYINGTLRGQIASRTSISSASVWTIGDNPPRYRAAGFPRTWNGVIDEVSIYNRALSSNEVAAIYAAGSAGKVTSQPYFVTATNLPNGLTGIPYSQTITASVTTGNTFSLIGGSLPSGLNLSTNGLISGTPATVGTNSFTILATSGLGQTNSQAFVLAVFAPPVISAQPPVETVTNGSPAYLAVGVSGSSPLFYQWRKNGTNLTNSTNVSGSATNALSLGTATTADAGNYSVIITNAYGSVTSSVVALTIIPATNQFNISLPLSTGSGNKLDLGFFAGGQALQLSFVGNGDLVNSTYQTLPDGSMFAPAGSPYGYGNPGANYPTNAGGDGINHYPGGGGNYDAGGGSGFPFAGKMTTDTTDPAGIRDGAVVGTFNPSPANTNWFYIGYGGTFTVPAGGAHLYVAVNDSVNSDDHGVYLGVLNGAVPAFSTTNLLLNPGAEAGTLTNWTVGGSSNPNVDNGTFDTGINPHTGAYDFYGGNGSYGSLSQTVSLIGNQGITAAMIDNSNLVASISFWEQGLNQATPSDDANVSVTFFGASTNVLNTVSTPVLDSHNNSWSNYANQYAIPSGTRFMQYTMNFYRNYGTALDAFVDDNYLSVIQPSVAGSVTPQPVQIISPQLSGGSFNLSFQTVSGQSYTLLYNNNLATTNWLPYTNLTGNGAVQQLAVPITNAAQRFFRLSEP